MIPVPDHSSLILFFTISTISDSLPRDSLFASMKKSLSESLFESLSLMLYLVCWTKYVSGKRYRSNTLIFRPIYLRESLKSLRRSPSGIKLVYIFSINGSKTSRNSFFFSPGEILWSLLSSEGINESLFKHIGETMKRGEFVPRDLVVDLVVNAIGGFPIEIKTEIRYHIICCYHNFIR